MSRSYIRCPDCGGGTGSHSTGCPGAEDPEDEDTIDEEDMQEARDEAAIRKARRFYP